jgi:hypothetical protein
MDDYTQGAFETLSWVYTKLMSASKDEVKRDVEQAIRRMVAGASQQFKEKLELIPAK